MMRYLVFTCMLVALSGVAWAGDTPRLIVGLGYDDVRDYREPSGMLSAEIEWGSVPPLPKLRWRAGSMIMLDGDVWLGAAVSYRTPLWDGPWFFEASFGPGLYYREDEAPGIGHLHFPMFRTQGGLGYRFNSGGTAAVLLSHLSDGGLDLDAGSSEQIIVTYSLPF